jgi:glyoxylase-like metal-dependent hydrolase (beta-lactamase superfamily II)
MSLKIKTFVEGPVEANNYLVINGDEAVLIDCSAYSQAIIDAAKGIDVKYILLTHGHFDHVLGVNEMKKTLNSKVLIHKDDVDWLKNINTALGMFGQPKAEIPGENGGDDELDLDWIEVIHTPGHTKGGVCYKIGDNLFSGDTLFYETVGRTDLPGGDFKTLKKSIEKLFALPHDTVVYPGHGQPTTIRHEKECNEIL